MLIRDSRTCLCRDPRAGAFAREYHPKQTRERVMNRILLTALVVGSVGISGGAWAADAAAGQAKSTACAMCHGPTGGGTQMGGKIAGMAPAAFAQAIADYKSGKKDNAAMKRQATQLTDADVANLAAYYATLK